jgi:hypothetical protein
MSSASRPPRGFPLQGPVPYVNDTEHGYNPRARDILRPDGTFVTDTPEQPALAGIDPAPAAAPAPDDPLLALDRELEALEAEAYAARFGGRPQLVPHRRLARFVAIVGELAARLKVTPLRRGSRAPLPAVLPGALMSLGDLYRPCLDARHALRALRDAQAHQSLLRALRDQTP